MQSERPVRQEWSIQQLAREAGVTSRTLRHYGDVGILRPSRTGANGMRFYDADALVRLQRVLLLRDLGLGLPAIRQVLDGDRDTVRALRTHLDLLEHERDLLDRRIEAVRSTITRTQEGDELVASEMFDGFDHTRHRDEVIERWGADAYETGDRWWRGMSDDERADQQQRVARLSRDWAAAARSGLDPAGPEAQELARRHIAWLSSVPGTPGHGTAEGSPREYVLGLADMYVADDRFAANYGGTEGAEFVRTVLRLHLQ